MHESDFYDHYLMNRIFFPARGPGALTLAHIPVHKDIRSFSSKSGKTKLHDHMVQLADGKRLLTIANLATDLAEAEQGFLQGPLLSFRRQCIWIVVAKVLVEYLIELNRG